MPEQPLMVVERRKHGIDILTKARILHVNYVWHKRLLLIIGMHEMN